LAREKEWCKWTNYIKCRLTAAESEAEDGAAVFLKEALTCFFSE